MREFNPPTGKTSKEDIVGYINKLSNYCNCYLEGIEEPEVNFMKKKDKELGEYDEKNKALIYRFMDEDPKRLSGKERWVILHEEGHHIGWEAANQLSSFEINSTGKNRQRAALRAFLLSDQFADRFAYTVLGDLLEERTRYEAKLGKFPESWEVLLSDWINREWKDSLENFLEGIETDLNRIKR